MTKENTKIYTPILINMHTCRHKSTCIHTHGHWNTYTGGGLRFTVHLNTETHPPNENKIKEELNITSL